MIIIEATKKTAEEMINKINQIQERTNQIQEKTNNPIKIEEISIADEILKFKELLEQGIITQDEFERKKKQLLG